MMRMYKESESIKKYRHQILEDSFIYLSHLEELSVHLFGKAFSLHKNGCPNMLYFIFSSAHLWNNENSRLWCSYLLFQSFSLLHWHVLSTNVFILHGCQDLRLQEVNNAQSITLVSNKKFLQKKPTSTSK